MNCDEEDEIRCVDFASCLPTGEGNATPYQRRIFISMGAGSELCLSHRLSKMSEMW